MEDMDIFMWIIVEGCCGRYLGKGIVEGCYVDKWGRVLWKGVVWINGEGVWGRGVVVNLLQGASEAGPGARLCRAPTPFGGVIEKSDTIWCKWEMSRILGNECKG